MMHIGANYLGGILKKLSDSKRKAAMVVLVPQIFIYFLVLRSIQDHLAVSNAQDGST